LPRDNNRCEYCVYCYVYDDGTCEGCHQTENHCLCKPECEGTEASRRNKRKEVRNSDKLSAKSWRFEDLMRPGLEPPKIGAID
jgi:hypothetical protein